jgi:hypothetical protein
LPPRAGLVCAALLGLAVVTAGAEEKTIALPPDHEFGRLAPGPNRELAQTRCQLCHSTDYIVRQPRVDARQWEGVVSKMVKVYGAPVSDADARAIVEYLVAAYGRVR